MSDGASRDPEPARPAGEALDEVELHARADELFRRALELDEAGRAALFSESERRSPAVAARARRLLQLDRELTSNGTEEDPAGLIGRALGPYEVLELIGVGGMGAVYRAVRREPAETVAIKVLPAYAASAARIERFQREVELLASFHHPGIVGFRHAGRTADGGLYLVMEHVDGTPLSPTLSAVVESVEKTVDFVIRVAAAVQHMHARATLHRDLKPDNVLVRADAGRPQPVLLDLGIARQLEPEGQEWAHRTVEPVGTPAYMSPEQLEARHDIDVTTDVYGLGAMLYELLTGRPPRGLGELAKWDREELRRRLAEPARLPSEVVSADVFGPQRAARRARQLAGDLDAIAVKALESDPADRYPSVEAFSADLYRWLDRRPVVARPIGAWGRAWRLVRRRPRTASAAGAALALLVASSIATRVSLAREREALAALARQVETTDRIRRFVTRDLFERAAPESAGPETPVIDLVRAAAESVGPELDDLPGVAVGMRSALLAVLARVGDLDAAEEQARAARGLARALAPDDPQRLEFEHEAARLLEQQNRHAEAEAALRALLPRLRTASGPVADIHPEALADLGVTLLGQNRLAEASLVLREALELFPEGDVRRYPALSNLTLVESDLNGPAAALGPMQQLLREIETDLGADHVWVMALSSNLASTYLELGDPERALPFAERARTRADALLDPDHTERLTVLNNLASCLTENGRIEEALHLRREVLERRIAVFGEASGDAIVAGMNLSTTLMRAGRHEEALEPAERALSNSLEVSGPDHPRTAQAHHALASVLDALGRRAESLAAYDAAIAIYERAEGNHVDALERARSQRAVAAARE